MEDDLQLVENNNNVCQGPRCFFSLNFMSNFNIVSLLTLYNMILLFQMTTTTMSTLLVVLLMMKHIHMQKISKVNVINISDWNYEDFEMVE